MNVNTAGKILLFNAAALILLVCAALVSAFTGSHPISLQEVIANPASPDAAILFDYRIPRILSAIVVGASLSASGVLLQVYLKNPLADPFVIGVSGGASLAGTIALTAGIGSSFALMSLSSFAGALISMILVYALAAGISRRISAMNILLIGIIYNSFAAAVIMFLKSVVRAEKAQEMLYWLMGTLNVAGVSWRELAVSYAIFALSFALIWRFAYHLNVFTLGADEAKSLGVDVNRLSKYILVSSSLMVACAVSLSGLIGFVGLIVPHAVRLATGSDNRLVLPVSAFAGALFLVVSDLIVRLIFPLIATETPVGVVTAFIGAPVFVYLLKKNGKTR